VLYKFDPTGGALAMGVAQGTDPSGQAGYAMLLFGGDESYRPDYVYTWAQAVAAGAGHGVAGSVGTGGGNGPGRGAGSHPGNGTHGGMPVRVTISIHLAGRHVTIVASVPPGSRLQCAVTRHGKHGWARDHYRACPAHFSLAGRHPGRYRLRARAAGVVVTRYVRVR
jgi:hypothetical protein